MVPKAKLKTETLFQQQLDPSSAFKEESSGNTRVDPFGLVSNEGTSVAGGVDASDETRQAPPPGEFPIYLLVVIVVVFLVMTSAFLYFVCRCLVRKKKRESQLATLTPARPTDHRMTGVRADQPIQFVVPTTVAVTTTTEDSETDYSSGGADRRRKRGDNIHPEQLQRGLYLGQPSSAFQGGKVGFSLRYDLRRSQLTVRMIGARDLPCRSHPCVRLVLLPDRTTRYVTKVSKKNTACPTFDESFSFCVRRDSLPDKRLKISLWDYDRFSRKCLIGQVLYNVRDSGLTNTLSVDATSGEIWVDTKQQDSMTTMQSAEMLLSLCYDPYSATLTLAVLKIRGLQQDKGRETAVYAKVTLYVRRKLVRTKKTPSRKKAPEVEFNSSFSIHVPQAALSEVDLLVAVCEKWPLGKRVLGRTQSGTNCLCDQGLQHWQDMLASPKSTCAQWHLLCG